RLRGGSGRSIRPTSSSGISSASARTSAAAIRASTRPSRHGRGWPLFCSRTCVRQMVMPPRRRSSRSSCTRSVLSRSRSLLMTRLEKFSRVAEIAEKRAEVATVKLAERVRGVASGEAQLTELHRFRNEYASVPGGDASLQIAELINRHRFLGRVDEAIAFQRAEVERQQKLLAQEQVACGRVRAKARALDNAVRRI